MPLVDLVMPKMGESIMEATILKWHKHPGDTVKQDETLLEIATDKVDSEIPSAAEGTLEEILFQVNDIVPIGSVIARIRTTVTEPQGSEMQRPPERGEDKPAETKEDISPLNFPGSSNGKRSEQNGNNRFYSPLVLNIASSEGVGLHELETIPGTGNEGRVTKKDIIHYLAQRKTGGGSQTNFADKPLPADSEYSASFSRDAASRAGSGEATSTAFGQEYPTHNISTGSGSSVEIIEMDRMRRLIADHMVRSKQTSPHVTSFVEADVTNLVLWREKVKKDFEKREGTKLTFTPLFFESVARCIKKYPLVNCSIEGTRIILKKNINIGMATALPNGNLIVPVIKNADQFNLVGLAKQVNQLADNARNNQLKPEDTQGGTFTMTNVGTFGSLMGTPIINQPQVAILAIGLIKKRPVVIESAQGDAIAIRHMVYLSLSYDHRIVDGSIGAGFLSEIAKDLENFSDTREI
jgi:2-oxoglutarate dehydrogenase E2 component (dihydrolipoamide succinyltransferase)